MTRNYYLCSQIYDRFMHIVDCFDEEKDRLEIQKRRDKLEKKLGRLKFYRTFPTAPDITELFLRHPTLRPDWLIHGGGVPFDDDDHPEPIYYISTGEEEITPEKNEELEELAKAVHLSRRKALKYNLIIENPYFLIERFNDFLHSYERDTAYEYYDAMQSFYGRIKSVVLPTTVDIVCMLQRNPKLSADWLLRGEGDMFRDEPENHLDF